MVRISAVREFHDAGPEKEKLALLTWCSAEVWCSCLSQRERVQAGVRHSGGSRLHDVGQITRIWGQDPPTQKGQFWGLFGPWKIIGSLCCGVCRKRDNSFTNNLLQWWGSTAAADCSAPNWSVSHYIVSPMKNPPPAVRPFVKTIWPLVELWFVSAVLRQWLLGITKLSGLLTYFSVIFFQTFLTTKPNSASDSFTIKWLWHFFCLLILILWVG